MPNLYFKFLVSFKDLTGKCHIMPVSTDQDMHSMSCTLFTLAMPGLATRRLERCQRTFGLKCLLLLGTQMHSTEARPVGSAQEDVSKCQLLQNWKDMGNNKPEEVQPLPLFLVLQKRTWREETGNTTRTAGYVWPFNCYLPLSCLV